MMYESEIAYKVFYKSMKSFNFQKKDKKFEYKSA